MSKACSTHGRDEKCIQYFVWVGILKGKDHLEDLYVDEGIT
jgi:hypothetical protein